MPPEVVGQEPEAPQLSPAEGTEEDQWDAAFPAEEPSDETDREEEEQPQEESEEESGGDDAEESRPEDGGTLPQKRLEWALAVAQDPSAIQDVPRRQRKTILTSVELANGIVPQLAWEQANWIGQQLFTAYVQRADKANEIDLLEQGDPQRFATILAGGDPQNFPDDVIQQWRWMRQIRSGQMQAPQPTRPQMSQPDPNVEFWRMRSGAALADYLEQAGPEHEAEIRQWAQEEGLAGIDTAQKAEAGYRKLKAHLDSLLGKTNGRTPAAVQHRRGLPKPEVSPGSVQVGGRATREEMNQRAFDGSESDAWSAVDF